MTLVAWAPAPLRATLGPRLADAASEAAVEVAWMVAFSALLTETLLAVAVSPAVVSTPWVALAMYAATSLLIRFSASDTPRDAAPPKTPPTAPAREAARVLAVIVEVSLAVTLTPGAVMPWPLTRRSPSWYAITSVAISLSEL